MAPTWAVPGLLMLLPNYILDIARTKALQSQLKKVQTNKNIKIGFFDSFVLFLSLKWVPAWAVPGFF